MPSLLSPRRADPDLELHATLARSEEARRTAELDTPPTAGWLLAAAGGGLAAALAGWVLVAGLVVVIWLLGDSGTLLGALRVGTELWLLGNGATARLGGTWLTLIPWGATLVVALLVSRVATFAVRHARSSPGAPVATGPGMVLRVAGLVTLGYAVPVLVTGVALNGAASGARGGLVSGLVVALAAGWAGCWTERLRLLERWPRLARALVRAMVAAQLAVLVVGAAALASALVVHREQVLLLTRGLDAGLLGGIALLVVQLAYLPNAVVWAGSYVLGAGFSLGQGATVAPAATQLGLLPSIPLLGALPDAGAGGPAELWWLVGGVAAGVVAGWTALRGRPAARFDETGLVGGLAGLLSGLLYVVLAWACRGDLGVQRLAGTGPRLLPLLVMATATLGLAGMLTGVVIGLGQRSRRMAGDGHTGDGDGDTGDTDTGDTEDTAVLATDLVPEDPHRGPRGGSHAAWPGSADGAAASRPEDGSG